MTDNATLPATGDVIAADEINGVKFQRMKIVHGNDGENDGDVSIANPLPVNIASTVEVTGQFYQATQPVSLPAQTIEALTPPTTVEVSNTDFGCSSLGNIPVSGSELPTHDANLADIVASINGMNDSMLYMLSAMLEKMPRLSRTDQVSVDMSDSSMNSSIPYFTTAVNNSQNGSFIFRMFEPWNFSDAGSVRIYNQITVV